MLLCVVFFIGAFVVYTSEADSPNQVIAGRHVVADVENALGGSLLRQRRKRTIVKFLASIGYDAVMRLRRGTTELPSDKKLTKVYAKEGGYYTALKDFNSLNPQKVSNFRLPSGRNEGKFGEVGDRTVMVEKRGEHGNPTVRLIRNMGTYKEGSDIIMYVKKKWLSRWLSG